MSEREQEQPEARGGIAWLTLVAASLVVLLALGAMLWPQGAGRHPAHRLLVFDSSGSEARVAAVFEPLREYLAGMSDGSLELIRVGTLADFTVQLAAHPDFILAPDGLAIGLSSADFLPLVVGRRPAPQNLRPRGVLVSLRTARAVDEPWRLSPQRTVLGDSVSLTATGVWRQQGRAVLPVGCACGPDPYDHSSVLHALRLGGFDYAVARQWDVARFFAEGLLDPADFAVRDLVGPVPDVVLMVSRQVPQQMRLRCGEGLNALGRQQGDEGPAERTLRRGLARMHLAGFNLLLEPDFDLVRKNYPASWLQGAD